MKNKNGLKPCPFCGEEEDIVIKKEIYNGDCKSLIGHEYAYVECLPCDVRTGRNWENDIDIEQLRHLFKNCSEMAKFDWNRRINESRSNK